MKNWSGLPAPRREEERENGETPDDLTEEAELTLLAPESDPLDEKADGEEKG